MSTELEKFKEKLRRQAAGTDSQAPVEPIVQQTTVKRTVSQKLATPLICSHLNVRLSGKDILKRISVTFKPGEITAILGPSGSGKSTLLKTVTSLLKADSGNVYYGKQEMKKCRDEFRAQLGYVPQDDIIHTTLRVEDALFFSAKLRLGQSLSDTEISNRVETVLNKLSLTERKRLRIKKLSGGQRKRVNIGVELLADPATLILDEPASGLDPGTESDLLDQLRALACEGRTVIMTTHSMEFLHKVDKIVFLVDGMLLFAGTRDDMLSHFKLQHISEVYKTVGESNVRELQSKFERSALFQQHCSAGRA